MIFQQEYQNAKMMPPVKSLAYLKAQIKKNPCLDIGIYLGAPCYAEFKKDIQLLIAEQKLWRAELAKEKIQRKADELGLPNHLDFADYILKLEESLSEMQNKIADMSYRIESLSSTVHSFSDVLIN